MPPAEITLDWLSLHHDICEEKEDPKAESLFSFVQKHAKHEPFLFNFRPNPAYRRLDFTDQAEIMSSKGFFEETPENAVALFNHVFGDTGFNLENLEAVEDSLSAKILKQYYERPRTVKDYCI